MKIKHKSSFKLFAYGKDKDKYQIRLRVTFGGQRQDFSTGRRTFIVNALSHGISPTIVMKWTGHASYSSMKPYIDIVDSIKATEMAKMNFMD